VTDNTKDLLVAGLGVIGAVAFIGALLWALTLIGVGPR
jgi:hypothetical protein